MAAVSEMQGAAGCVVNSPATAEMVEHITNIADIPVIATVVRCDDDAHAKVRAGAKILNIAAGKNTPPGPARAARALSQPAAHRAGR